MMPKLEAENYSKNVYNVHLQNATKKAYDTVSANNQLNYGT